MAPLQPQAQPLRPIRVAHRGGNSRRALRDALAAGVDWIEADIWLHYGRLVARHDRSVGRLPITYSRRSVSIRLAPALVLDTLIRATAASSIRLLIDLKGDDPNLAAAIVETLRRHEAHGRSALCGQDWRPLDAARRLDPETNVIFSLGRPEHLAAYLARRRDGTAPATTSCFHGLLTPATAASLKEAGSTIVAWTVDAEHRARELLAMGVDGITSNDYAMLNRLGLPPLA